MKSKTEDNKPQVKYTATHQLGMVTSIPYKVVQELIATKQATKMGDVLYMGYWTITQK
jgi:hypothetical protein